jgi:HAD superfamily hydrolase (TIGR01509 family)
MIPIVFDCDGVLVDSEHLAWDAWRAVLESHGGVLEPDDIARFTGRSERETYEALSRRVDLPPYARFSDELAEALAIRFEASLEAFEDAVDTIATLHRRGHRLAVASSSTRRRLDESLHLTGLAAYFEVSVAGDEVSRGKPAPDLFLAALERLGVDEAIAVEDSPAGIAAAKAAGLFVVAVDRGRFAPSELAGADRVVPVLTPAAVMDR